MINPGFVLAIALALVHGFATKLTFFSDIPRYRWTSFAGGVSLSYVFLKIFPDLSSTQAQLQYINIPLMHYLKNHVYILALTGLLVFYRLDIWAYKTKSSQQSLSSKASPPSASFWIHLGAFAILNGITGYLIQDLRNYSLTNCIIFFVPLALYFFVIDDSLREHQQFLYDHQGRWFLVGAIIVGTVIGQVTRLNEAMIAIIWSFLAGTIILNVLKRELPDEKESCFSSFITGSTLYAALSLLS